MRHSSSTIGSWTKISLIWLGFWVLSGIGLVLSPGGLARAEGPAKSRYEILKERAQAEEAREKDTFSGRFPSVLRGPLGASVTF